MKLPSAMKYIAAAALALLVCVPLWMFFVSWVIEPEYTVNAEVSMANRLTWWLLAPITAVVLIAGWRWYDTSTQATVAGIAALKEQSVASATDSGTTDAGRREYVLEVIGLGVTLDKYRQGKLWEALTQGHPFASIREQDPKNYPWAADDKEGQEGGRAASTLKNGVGKIPLYWPAPSFCANNPALSPISTGYSPEVPVGGVVAAAESNGLAWTLFVSAGWLTEEHPDRLLERAFAFFDAHPDVPYVVVDASDGLYFRNLYRTKGTESLVKDGYYIPPRPDSSALFVLARRERVEAIRPFAVDDADSRRDLLAGELNRRSLSRRLGLHYYELGKTIQPRAPDTLMRSLTVPEWMDESTRIAKSKEFQPSPAISSYAHRFKNLFDNDDVSHVPANYKPTPWFPVPWTRDQLADFDKLPTLGYLHRPVYIKLTDPNGHPFKRSDDRLKAFLAGWQQALETLPEDQRKTALQRVITATGGSTDKTVALNALLHAQAEAGGPELDASKPAQWINTDARLGNTGAATWFVQIGIGVLASHIDGGVSAAINYRDDKEASLIFISPPPEDKRLKQNADNVFKNDAKPAIDPANYRNP